MKITRHLLRRTAKKCPQRIKDTPAVLFCLSPCIYLVLFKRLTEGQTHQTSKYRSQNQEVVKDILSISLLKIACPEVYLRVHFWTRVFVPQKHRSCIKPLLSLAVLKMLGARKKHPQARCFVEPPPSVAVLKHPFRKPFEIDGVDTRRERKLTAGVSLIR